MSEEKKKDAGAAYINAIEEAAAALNECKATVARLAQACADSIEGKDRSELPEGVPLVAMSTASILAMTADRTGELAGAVEDFLNEFMRDCINDLIAGNVGKVARNMKIREAILKARKEGGENE